MGAAERLGRRAREVAASRTPDVPSPCISICRMDPVTQWCEGCFRTLDEIAGWARMGDEEKRQVWRMIQQRVQARSIDRAVCQAEKPQENRQRP
jgi:uncharacterized protein